MRNTRAKTKGRCLLSDSLMSQISGSALNPFKVASDMGRPISASPRKTLLPRHLRCSSVSSSSVARLLLNPRHMSSIDITASLKRTHRRPGLARRASWNVQRRRDQLQQTRRAHISMGSISVVLFV